jgi:hypothetical protein
MKKMLKKKKNVMNSIEPKSFSKLAKDVALGP